MTEGHCREGAAPYRFLAHQRFIFELMITDILIPEGEGLETIRQLRQATPDVKIIAISSGGQSGSLNFLDAAESLGVDRG